jgi:hypothetical protein
VPGFRSDAFELSKAAITRESFAGDTIVLAGSTESDLFVILDGRATVLPTGTNGRHADGG